MSLLNVLFLTILIEYPIVQLLWIIVKKEEQSRFLLVQNNIVIIPVLIVNILTNPAINIFARQLLYNTSITIDTFWIIITLLEFIIWAIEGVLYKYMLNTKWSNALALSIGANFVSYLSSFIL